MAAGFPELVMLLFDWFMLFTIMVLSIKNILTIMPAIKKTVAAKVIWYLLTAFGYSLICVTIFTSWVIWFIGGLWGLITLFLTWFILIYIFLSYRKIGGVLA
jgi:hypothetical protein